MDGHVTVYRDRLGKGWIVDLDGGSRENPGSHREGFRRHEAAIHEALVITECWRALYPHAQVRNKIQAAERAHKKAAQARRERLSQAA